MKKKEQKYTAKIVENIFCLKCGWPVIHACCNDEFIKFKDAKNWDWWLYCSNKGCEKHNGEGVFQKGLDWVGK